MFNDNNTFDAVINMPKRTTHSLKCCRCDDELEFQDSLPITLDNRSIKLSINEMAFIKAKFKGPLCVACLNQLKTSYKILNGDYNKPANTIFEY